MRRLSYLLFLLALLLVVTSIVQAFTWQVPVSFTDDTKNYMSDIDLDGTRLAVAARNTEWLNEYGVVTIYEWDGSQWVTGPTLDAGDDKQQFDFFGASLDLDGDRLLVGSYGWENVAELGYVGRAYLFDFDGANWNLTKTFVAPNIDSADYFGTSVSLDGNRVVIGARDARANPDKNDFGWGEVYIYDFDGANWFQSGYLAPEDADMLGFGNKVELEGNTLIVGTIGWIGSTQSNQFIYPYEFDGQNWVARTRLEQSDPTDLSAGFGNAIDLYGDQLIVGASSEDEGENGSVGSVYYYTRNLDTGNWEFQTKFNPDSAVTGDFFGTSVAFDGDFLIVGAVGEDYLVDGVQTSRKGAAYLYRFNGASFDFEKRFAITDAGAANDYFGQNSAVGNYGVIVQEPFRDLTLTDQGYIHTFLPELPPATAVLATADGRETINLSWNPSDETALSYSIERSPDGVNDWVEIDTSPTNSYIDIGLTCETPYFYRVYAHSFWQTSVVSNTGGAQTDDCPPFDPPTDVVSGASGENAITLTWSLAQEATSTTIERSSNGVSGWTEIASGITDVTYTDTTVDCDTTYFYRLYGVNGEDVSDPSEIVSATTDKCSLELIGGDAGDFELGLAGGGWTVANKSKDKIKCNKDKDGDGVIDKFFSFSGECAFRFKGGVDENSRLLQVVKLRDEGYGVGDTLTFSAMVKAGTAVDTRVKVRVKHVDDFRDKLTFRLSPTEGYEMISGFIDFQKEVINIKFNARNYSTTGKVYIDAVDLRILIDNVGTQAITATSVEPLPLPEAPDDFRGR